MAEKPLNESEIEEAKKDLSNALALKVVHDSKGGQILIEGLVTDILGAIDTLCGPVMDLPGYIAISARIKERLDIVTVLTGAKSQSDFLQTILKEAIKRQKENPEDTG